MPLSGSNWATNVASAVGRSGTPVVGGFGVLFGSSLSDRQPERAKASTASAAG
jgi:hypothetical protein